MCHKSKVTPSQALNNTPYDCWIITKKDAGKVPGGQIVSAYCTCTASMLVSCNYIAGVLFRMEHAVKTGMTKPEVTQKLYEWTIPTPPPPTPHPPPTHTHTKIIQKRFQTLCGKSLVTHGWMDEFRCKDASTHEGHLRQNGKLTWFCNETVIMISHICIKCKTRTNITRGPRATTRSPE